MKQQIITEVRRCQLHKRNDSATEAWHDQEQLKDLVESLGTVDRSTSTSGCGG